jgi:hypothetical protein
MTSTKCMHDEIKPGSGRLVVGWVVSFNLALGIHTYLQALRWAICLALRASGGNIDFIPSMHVEENSHEDENQILPSLLQ